MNFFDSSQSPLVGPRVDIVRHELKLRSLQVESVSRLTPRMLRITFSGDDLGDFASLAFDDHVKIHVPTSSGEIERRDYTPRRYDRAARVLMIDFAIHDDGPASRWALSARPGDRLRINGPKGSKVIAADEVRHWLLIGDESALPAIGRHIEEARGSAEITSVVAVSNAQEQQSFKTDAQLTALWTHRPLLAANDPEVLLSMVRTLDLRAETFVWIAGEAGVARALRNHFIEERRHPASWMKAGGYWVMGHADAHERLS